MSLDGEIQYIPKSKLLKILKRMKTGKLKLLSPDMDVKEDQDHEKM
ncbi:MAG: hypothetical protein ACHQYP_05890 [Nitrospiria bacterium]